MKDKFIIFVIGVLVGAVISTGAFYIYSTTTGKCDCSNQNTQMNGGEPPEKPSGENGQPPAKPGENNSQNSNSQENS